MQQISFHDQEFARCHHRFSATQVHLCQASSYARLCIVNCSKSFPKQHTQTYSACFVIAPLGFMLGCAWLKGGSVLHTAGTVSSSSWLMMPQAISQSNEGEVALLRWIYSTVVCQAVIHSVEPPFKYTLRRNRWQPLPGDATTKTQHTRLVSSTAKIRPRFNKQLVVMQESVVICHTLEFSRSSRLNVHGIKKKQLQFDNNLL